MGKPVVGWWEITLPDKAASDKEKKFFGEVFGWKIENDPKFDYGMVSEKDSGMGGGIGPTAPGNKGQLTFYVSVDDLAGYLQKIEQAGGRTVSPPMKVEGGPEIAHFSDPAGNVIGLMKA